MKAASIALLLALGRILGAQTPPAAGALNPDGFQISVDVDLVVLQASVRDRQGHAVEKLGPEDFAVFEDGVPQRIRLFRHEDTPVTAGLVIDHSGSMREKLADVIAGARAFVDLSNSRDQIFVVNFNDTVQLGLPMGTPFSDSSQKLGDAIGAEPAIGTTALYDAIAEALKRLNDGASDKKVLVVISDGGDNASNASLDRVLKLAEQSNAVIYTIGIYEPEDLDKNPKVLRRLAAETGGEAFFPEELSEAVGICKQIARDIRNQYTLGYSSTYQKRDGTYHKVRVIARAKETGRLSVRTRAGYSTTPASPAAGHPVPR